MAEAPFPPQMPLPEPPQASLSRLLGRAALGILVALLLLNALRAIPGPRVFLAALGVVFLGGLASLFLHLKAARAPRDQFARPGDAGLVAAILAMALPAFSFFLVAAVPALLFLRTSPSPAPYRERLARKNLESATADTLSMYLAFDRTHPTKGEMVQCLSQRLRFNRDNSYLNPYDPKAPSVNPEIGVLPLETEDKALAFADSRAGIPGQVAFVLTLDPASGRFRTLIASERVFDLATNQPIFIHEVRSLQEN